MRTNMKMLYFSGSNFHHLRCSNPIRSSLFLCFSYTTCSITSPTQIVVSGSKQKQNAKRLIVKYLIDTFNFTKTRATSVASRFPWISSPQRSESVLHFLRNIGFSEPQIKASVYVSPQILFADIAKTLKPKLELFQEMGLEGLDLGNFISKNSSLLTLSLDKKLMPSINILKTILANDKGNKNLILVLKRCSWVISKYPNSRLLGNIEFLESCGIVESQLAMLLKRQPRLFVTKEPALRELVSRVLDLGIPVDSRMLVHALYTISGQSDKTFSRKIELLKSFGFSENECKEMFRRAPGLLRASEDKLRSGIEFFFDKMKYEKSWLVHRPSCLMHSMKDRIIPRYTVLQLLKEKKLLNKEPSFTNILNMTEEDFLKKFVSKFSGDVEELLYVYRAHMVDTEEV